MKVVAMPQRSPSASRSRPLAGELDPPLAAGGFPPAEGRSSRAPSAAFFGRREQAVTPACRRDHILALRVAPRSRAIAGLRYPSRRPLRGFAFCHANLRAPSPSGQTRKIPPLSPFRESYAPPPGGMF